MQGVNGQTIGNLTHATNQENNRINPRPAETPQVENRNSKVKKSIKCLNTNAQSLQYKIEELSEKMKTNEVQIASVTESWGQEWKESTLEIKGYNMYKKHREDGRRGGGCVIYVNKELKSYTCSQMRNIQGDDSVWCWVKLNERTRILVGCIYRSPN